MRAFLCLLIVLGFAVRSQAMRWNADLPSALATARKSKKLVMVAFHAEWSGWCRKMQDTYSSKLLSPLEGLVVAVRANVEGAGRRIADTYDVYSYPTVLFLDGNGELVGKVEGYQTPRLFVEQVTELIDVPRQAPVIQARLHKNPNDPEANARFACFQAWKGRNASAQAALARAAAGGYAGPDMAKAYNAVGDNFQISRQFRLALECFEQARKVASDGRTKAYAVVSKMYCYMSLQQQFKAKEMAEQVVSMKESDAQWVRSAQAIIRRMLLGRSSV